MRRFIYPCLLFGLSLSSRALGGPPRGPTFHVTLADPLSIAPSSFSSLAEEVRRILGEAGVQAKWRNGGHSRVQVSDDCLVILLPRAPLGGREKTLGAVLGGVDRGGSAWVFWEATVGALHLDPNLRKDWTRDQKDMVSRALGRIAAHELVHILLPSFPHGGRGLMAQQLSHADLTGASIGLDPTIIAALHALGDTRLTLGFRDAFRAPVNLELELPRSD
jgi:hypothetical protein